MYKQSNIYVFINVSNTFSIQRNNILENKEIDFFKGMFYGYKSKIKIVGRGWKIIKSNYNTLLIKLGFSHPLFLLLDGLIKYKIKKKKKILCFLRYLF